MGVSHTKIAGQSQQTRFVGRKQELVELLGALDAAERATGP
jgi:hypothetical protein